MCMQNCTMTWSLTGLSWLFSTLSMGHPQTGIPRDKQHQKLLHMDQNMWHQGLLLTKIVHIRYTLMYLGVPIRSKSFMFGDNKSVVTSSTIPNTPRSKGTTFQHITGSGRPFPQNTSSLSGKMAS